jgi:lipopolysaccharide biosynthesis regulator YciM
VAACTFWSAAGLAAILAVGIPVETDAVALAERAADVLPRRTSLLRSAHTLHPRNTSISIALALELERKDGNSDAERVLREAERYDRQYLPAWTLANFYFRHNQEESFWNWARRAAELNPGDFRPLLRLAMHQEASAQLVLNRMGRRPELLRAYLDLLIADQSWRDTTIVRDALRAHRDPTDQARFAALAERLPPEFRE